MDVSWLAVDHLPNTGVQISVIVFGGLTLLILGGGLFLAGRRHHRPSPPPSPRIRTDLILAQKAQRGFAGDTIGQADSEGGESGPPECQDRRREHG